MTVNEKTEQINGLNVHYLEDGTPNKPALLLIHGGIGDARFHWETAMPALADDFHVFAPDLPGFSKSDLLPQMRTENVVGWIQAFLKHLDIDEAVVIGNSHGGLVARLFAATNPVYVPALILLNGGGVPDVPGVMRALERIPGISNAIFYFLGSVGTSPNTVKGMFHNQDLITDEFLKQIRAGRKGFTRMLRMLISSSMPKARSPLMPTLILWGADDQIATINDAEAIKNSIPGAVLTEIADCGHMPQLETPDVFIWQVNTFLEKLSRPAKSNLPGPGILPTLPS